MKNVKKTVNTETDHYLTSIKVKFALRSRFKAHKNNIISTETDKLLNSNEITCFRLVT